MTSNCPDTYVGIRCLICDRMGSRVRPVVSIDDWYPKPPDPCPDPDDIFIPWLAFAAMFVIMFALAFVLAHFVF